MKSLEDLKKIRESMQSELGLTDNAPIRVVVGLATCGIASGARPVLDAVSEEVKKQKIDNVNVYQTGCIGLCQYEPIMEVLEPGKEKVTYVKMTPEKAKEVVTKHLKQGTAIPEYTLGAENN